MGPDPKDLAETPRRILSQRSGMTENILAEELGRRYVDYREQWVRASRREIVTPFPLYIQIEHGGRCNLRCPSCVQGDPDLRADYTEGLTPMDLPLYEKILSEAGEHKCPSISFHNNDEPLLLKDMEKRIRMAKDAGFLDLIMTSNATLLRPERAKGLLEAGLTKLNFSVDAFQEEDYKKRRVGGDFQTTVRNIKHFMAERDKAGLRLPITRATCVLTKFSVGGMEEFREFWGGIVDVVEFQNFQALSGITEDMRPPRSRVDAGFKCNSPWQQVAIRPNGDVLPCCSFYGRELNMGSLRERSLGDIWNSERMNWLRTELAKDNYDFHSACNSCAKTFYTSSDE